MAEEDELNQRWYAVYTLPNKEVIARRHIERQGWLVFLPLIEKTRRHARRITTVHAALFSRYLFVRMNVARDRWRSINGTTGVACLVMSGDRPLAVPPGLVEALACAVRPDGVIEPDYGYRPGDRVRLVAGPLAGGIGELLALDDKGRVELLLTLLSGSMLRVRMARTMLQPLV
ncbi:transcriptional activator RfaH [Prosthecomicrobium hirschii]|uniref:transcription termination/antitermination protein NusG n=1 Tax=Prosthecodimorpha hirschii TaxID=665126 RepID=UPI00112DEFCE|nr:transcriptional activator RfaH [Prosthecomicrobium hirschii]TPQ49421.1 transcriptional activator RfaH [Prosthecomicrobium hirschii]